MLKLPTSDRGWGHTTLAVTDDLPVARVVRHRGVANAAAEDPPGPLGQHLRTLLVYAIGLWPLTGVVLLSIGLTVAATR